jgi:OOP family OmpA-OmpF porin
MKKIIYLLLITGFSFLNSYAQNTSADYDKWSFEVGVGQSKGLVPYTVGYFSANPEKYFNFSQINHFEGGFRYMFNPKFGIKLDGSYNSLKPEENNGSLPYQTNVIRIGAQFVINLSRVMGFESFTKRFGLLVNGGVQVHQAEYIANDKFSNFYNTTFIEDNGGVMFGLTPQFRISNTFALHTNLTYLYNTRQHYNWDGQAKNYDENLVGTMFNVSAGITAYIGKKDVHADWFAEDLTSGTKADPELDNLRNRLRNMETKMTLDSDKDGIPDYLDGCPFEAGTKENNGCPDKDTDGDGVLDKDDECVTIPGPVDNKGCPYSDKDGDKVADIDDNCPEDPGPASNKGCPRVDKKVRQQLQLLAKNIFFDTGKSTITDRSNATLLKVKDIMVQYPNVKFKILGHTDDRGNFDKNMKLSDDRAAAVVTWLASKGISTSNLLSEGFGSTKPVAPNTTDAGRAANRRTEIDIIEED